MTDGADAAPGPKRPARVRILEAMITLDDHRSVHEHTVDELAAIAGVAKGSVYYQFGSKARLVREMLVHGGEELRVMMDAAAERQMWGRPKNNGSRLGDVGSDLVFLWSHLPESNRRPFHYEWNALPTELRWPACSVRRANIHFTAQWCFLANCAASASAAGACWGITAPLPRVWR